MPGLSLAISISGGPMGGTGLAGPIPNFLPNQQTDLAGWWRADLGITLNAGNVSTWSDQGGLGDHATQGVAASQPLFQATGGPNETPCVTFDGTDDFLSRALAGALGRDLFFVIKQTTSRDHPFWGAFVDGSNRTSCAYLSTSVHPVHTIGGVDQARKSDTGVATGTDWRILEFNLIESVNTLFKNGTQIDTTAATGGYLPSGAQYIGTATNSGVWFQGSIAEIISFSTARTQFQRDQIETYLSSRYAITVV